ncbi:MAG: 4Fe-4S ferredoxin [Candidatus Wallbacteria bacterium HGW-Wallbacteria-1]|jgi:hypothetical protein|uniref:4Fe-4S ferredoxin n=1 Tax=Candidatus Wallbacteria bacterium HGW-Wallbacteria-1 TaxID=2013854 RepID=A0A2N1PRX7_9BACT|nr:MAG: 4Fe-4S ferredoxin [Candidatus Wallbacteria bacterium HGW-Wallbacteria-1]
MASNVFFHPVNDPAEIHEVQNAVTTLWEAADAGSRICTQDLVAVKIHVGELANNTHLLPEHVAPVVTLIKQSGGLPFLAETSTIYKGERDNAVRHILHANANGFSIEKTGAPFISLDGLVGNSEIEVTIPGKIFERVLVARDAVTCDGLVAISHPTGHLCAGLGACLKNLGMGLASRTGKLRQHSTVEPLLKSSKCTFCRKCEKWCPEHAIIPDTESKSITILKDKCVGCGECISLCRFGALNFDWNKDSGTIQKAMAEHALGAITGKMDKTVFINILINMTPECDCMGMSQKKVLPDKGVLLSFDPVAIDAATLALATDEASLNLSKLSHPDLDPMVQLEHAAAIGMGTTDFRLIQI